MPVQYQILIFAAFFIGFYFIFDLAFFIRIRRSYQIKTANDFDYRRIKGALGLFKPYLTSITNTCQKWPFLKNLYYSATRRYWALLQQAGNPGNLTAYEYCTFTWLFPTGMLLFLTFFEIFNHFKLLPLIFILFIFSIIWPQIWIKNKAADRRSSILRVLPNAIDEITLLIKAGLGFEQAIDGYLEGGITDPLKEEFYLMRSEMRLGRSRAETMTSLATRINNDDINAFATTIIQSESTGISITEVITKQSEIVRERYFQKIEEQGAKAPLKMLIPMMLFVLPCIFLIIFTPLIIQGLAAK